MFNRIKFFLLKYKIFFFIFFLIIFNLLVNEESYVLVFIYLFNLILLLFFLWFFMLNFLLVLFQGLEKFFSFLSLYIFDLYKKKNFNMKVIIKELFLSIFFIIGLVIIPDLQLINFIVNNNFFEDDDFLLFFYEFTKGIIIISIGVYLCFYFFQKINVMVVFDKKLSYSFFIIFYDFNYLIEGYVSNFDVKIK